MSETAQELPREETCLPGGGAKAPEGKVKCGGCGRVVTPRARCGRGWMDDFSPVGAFLVTAWYACPHCRVPVDPPRLEGGSSEQGIR